MKTTVVTVAVNHPHKKTTMTPPAASAKLKGNEGKMKSYEKRTTKGLKQGGSDKELRKGHNQLLSDLVPALRPASAALGVRATPPPAVPRRATAPRTAPPLSPPATPRAPTRPTTPVARPPRRSEGPVSGRTTPVMGRAPRRSPQPPAPRRPTPTRAKLPRRRTY